MPIGLAPKGSTLRMLGRSTPTAPTAPRHPRMIGESRLRAPSTSRRPVEPMRHDADDASMAGVDVNRGAKRAREARAALGLDPAAPLACLLSVVEEDARLPVVVCAMPDGVAGACFRTDTGAV